MSKQEIIKKILSSTPFLFDRLRKLHKRTGVYLLLTLEYFFFRLIFYSLGIPNAVSAWKSAFLWHIQRSLWLATLKSLGRLVHAVFLLSKKNAVDWVNNKWINKKFVRKLHSSSPFIFMKPWLWKKCIFSSLEIVLTGNINAVVAWKCAFLWHEQCSLD